jgi:hypothetical protein
MDPGVTQAQAAKSIGVGLETVHSRERGRIQGAPRFLPGILRFLGEDLRPRPKGLPARLRAASEAQG